MIERYRAGSGFTLIEIVLAVALLAVFIGMAVPGLGRLYEKQLFKRGVRDIRVALYLAQDEAVARRKDCRVRIDPELRAYWIEEAIDHKVPSEKEYKPFRTSWGRARKIPWVVTEISGPVNITIRPDGRMEPVELRFQSEGGTWILSTKEKVGEVILRDAQGEVVP